MSEVDFTGKYKLESSEKFDDFLKELGTLSFIKFKTMIFGGNYIGLG